MYGIVKNARLTLIFFLDSNSPCLDLLSPHSYGGHHHVRNPSFSGHCEISINQSFIKIIFYIIQMYTTRV